MLIAASPVLIAAINDLLLGASLVPVRETRAGGRYHRRSIETAAPSALLQSLNELASDLRLDISPMEPKAIVGSTGYHPEQRLGERLTRLTLLNLESGPRIKLRDHDLFRQLLSAEPWLLAEARYAASGAEQAAFYNTSGAAAINQLLRTRPPPSPGCWCSASASSATSTRR